MFSLNKDFFLVQTMINLKLEQLHFRLIIMRYYILRCCFLNIQLHILKKKKKKERIGALKKISCNFFRLLVFLSYFFFILFSVTSIPFFFSFHRRKWFCLIQLRIYFAKQAKRNGNLIYCKFYIVQNKTFGIIHSLKLKTANVNTFLKPFYFNTIFFITRNIFERIGSFIFPSLNNIYYKLYFQIK